MLEEQGNLVQMLLLKDGYNGGGSGHGGNDGREGSGGGATHIAFKSGVLSSLSEDIDEILIVAGGGGGSCYWYNAGNNNSVAIGGSGGGYIGGTGKTVSYKINSSSFGGEGQGGTQEQGGAGGKAKASWMTPPAGSFGRGGSVTSAGYCGGGGGFFGGGSAAEVGTGGGSGYIANLLLSNKHMVGFDVTEAPESEVSIYTIKTENIDDTPIADTAKKGDGYVKITLLT